MGIAKKILYVILVVVIQNGIWGQSVFEVTVVETKSLVAIPYVNIGIEGTNIGSLTDSSGHVKLQMPERHYNADSVTISHIGYKDVKVPIYSEMNIDTIKLMPMDLLLPTTTISSFQFSDKDIIILGKNKNKTSATFRFASNRLGTELGVHIKTKNDSVMVKSLNFNVFRNDYSKTKFRVHLYEFDSDSEESPFVDLMTNTVVEYTRGLENIWRINILSQGIVINPRSDYIMSIEWLEDLDDAGSDIIQFAAGIGFKRNIFYKNASQSKWKPYTKKVFGFNVNLAFSLEGYKF